MYVAVDRKEKYRLVWEFLRIPVPSDLPKNTRAEQQCDFFEGNATLFF